MSKPKRMLASTVAKRLEAAEEAYQQTIQAIADEVMQRVVIPFCNKLNLAFRCGMGTFIFIKENGDTLSAEWADESLLLQKNDNPYSHGTKVPGSVGVAKACCTHVEPYGQWLAIWMKDYTPPGFKEQE